MEGIITDALVLLVGREARRRRRGRSARLLLRLRLGLHEAVDDLEAVERLLQDRLRGALIRDRLLELLVLLLAILARALDLHLHLRDLGLELIDLLGERVDGGGEILDLRNEIVTVARLIVRGLFVLVNPRNAPIAVLDLLL